MEQSPSIANIDPNYVPDEYKEQYDVIELPSQGILYPNKKSTVKVSYLTTIDENILSSPNIINSGKLVDILLERKVKDLGFDTKDLLDGDRMAILVFLRATGLGDKYAQPVLDPNTSKVVSGEIDLPSLKQKKLTVQPGETGGGKFLSIKLSLNCLVVVATPLIINVLFRIPKGIKISFYYKYHTRNFPG